MRGGHIGNNARQIYITEASKVLFTESVACSWRRECGFVRKNIYSIRAIFCKEP